MALFSATEWVLYLHLAHVCSPGESLDGICAIASPRGQGLIGPQASLSPEDTELSWGHSSQTKQRPSVMGPGQMARQEDVLGGH